MFSCDRHRARTLSINDRLRTGLKNTLFKIKYCPGLHIIHIIPSNHIVIATSGKIMEIRKRKIEFIRINKVASLTKTTENHLYRIVCVTIQAQIKEKEN